MTQYEKDLSNISYTNKDFGVIYPELLDLVKKISYKWDPSSSDECDPGVVLLKLAALMADKNNYNIDKNILELFPLSVTQEHNARQLFDQCGYCMKYYQSATTDVELVLENEPRLQESLAELGLDENSNLDASENMRTYVIPRFTMISDVDNNQVYTLTENVSIRSDKRIQTASAIQGVVNAYTINNETTITAANLDYNNRLYFAGLFVPENGIFISSVDSEDYQDWKKVDNLLLQPPKTKCYKFGLSENGYSCYIEFPTDIDSIIGSGITIHYVTTRGVEGNIGKNKLRQFYSDIKVTRNVASYTQQDVSLTSADVFITNPRPATNGKDPETIDEAYKNYQKVKTTFDTLVSPRDYSNFLYTNENYSNGFVCDRDNDVQSSYKVVQSQGDRLTTYTHVQNAVKERTLKQADGTILENIAVEEPEMTAFDLKVYGLRYVDSPTTIDTFNRTFTLILQNSDTAADWHNILTDTEDIKFIPHNYKEFEKDRILMLKNKYPITAKIIPQFKLTVEQQLQIVNNVIYALFKALNSRNIEFGSPVAYDTVYDIIVGADSRIKAITLDEISYETFAVYTPDGTTLQELRIDSKSTKPSSEKEIQLWESFRNDIYVKSILAGKTQFLNPDNGFSYALNQQNGVLIENIDRLTTETLINADVPKSQLARNEDGELLVDSVDYYTSQLRPNENIVFTAPNMIIDENYSSYVKFIHNIGQSERCSYQHADSDKIVVSKNADYTLKKNEYIVFFWKTEDSEYAPYHYIKYDGNTENLPPSGESKINTISPSFYMSLQSNPDNRTLPPIPDDILNSLKCQQRYSTDTVEEKISGKINILGESHNVVMNLNEYVTALVGSEFVLTGSNMITTKKSNVVHINDPKNGIKNIFWILNEQRNGRCVLFDENETSYVLKNDEYLFYSNAKKTQLAMLGAGTLIERSGSGSSVAWDCAAINYDDFVAEDVSSVENQWFQIPEDTDVIVTEMQFHQLGPGNVIRLTRDVKPNDTFTDRITFKNGTTVDRNDNECNLSSYTISYIDELGVETVLPQRNAPELSWRGYSILNLNVSPTRPQFIDIGQSITAYRDDGVEIGTILSNDQMNNKGVNILTDKSVSLTGGTKVNVASLDLASNNLTTLMIYGYNDSTDPGQWTFNNFKSYLSIAPTSYDVGNLLPEDVNKRSDSSVGWIVRTGDKQSDNTAPVSCEKFNGKDSIVVTPVAIDVTDEDGKPKEDESGNIITTIAPLTYSYYTGIKVNHTYEFTCSVRTYDPGDSTEIYVFLQEVGMTDLNDKINKDDDTYYPIPFNGEEPKQIRFNFTPTEIEKDNPIGTCDGNFHLRIEGNENGFSKFVITDMELRDITDVVEGDNDYVTHSLDFSAPTGEYILPMNVTNSFTNLRVYYESKAESTEPDESSLLKTIQGNDDYATGGMYYLRFDVNNPSNGIVNGRLVVQAEFVSSNDATRNIIEFGTLFKFKNVDTPVSQEAAIELLSQLDVENQFNYTYVVPKDSLIENPLDSKEFVNPLHIFNPYTICQWNTSIESLENIVVVNKIK